MKVIILSDLTECPGGVHHYMKQIEDFVRLKDDISLKIFLEIKTRDSVIKSYDFQETVFIPLSTKYHNVEIILNDLELLLKNENPDVIHFINGSIKSNLITREFIAKRKFKFIVTEQFIDDSLQIEKKVLQRIKEVNKATSKVIYVSKANREIAKNLFNIDCTSKVVYNSIKPTQDKKILYRKEPNKCFTTARCVHQKGIDIVIKALARIKNKKLVFHVFGDGERRSEYEQLAKKLLGDNHEFKVMGWHNNLDFKYIKEAYDLFIAGSRQEGMSFSLVEAASIGMPIVCSDTSGNKELIEISQSGYLFSNGSEEELSDRLEDFFYAPTQLNSIAKESSATIDEHFSQNKNLKILLDLYQQMKQK